MLAVETGNEFGACASLFAARGLTREDMLQQGAPPLSFTQGIASYIKSVAPNALVIDGTDGVSLPNGQGIPGLSASAVDIVRYGRLLPELTDAQVSNHYYPPSAQLLNSDFSLSSAAKKVLLIGTPTPQTPRQLICSHASTIGRAPIPPPFSAASRVRRGHVGAI